MRLSVTPRARPTGLQIAVQRSHGVDGIRTEIVLGIALRRARKFYRFSVTFDLKFSHEKIAFRSLVIAESGAVCGQTLVRQGFESNRSDFAWQAGELQFVGVALRD